MASQRQLSGRTRKESEESIENELGDMFCASQEYHDVTCSPCSKENRDVAATKYCVECANYLCQMCLNQHNRFGMMKYHRIIDTAAAKESVNEELPVQRCNRHRGNVLDMYCSNHEDVCCAVCAAIDHRTCEGTRHLSDVLKESEHNKPDCEDICYTISSLQKDVGKLKLARSRNSEIFESDKADITKLVENIRKMVDKRVVDLENNLMERIDKETMIEKAVNEYDAQKLEYAELALKDQKQSIERVRKSGNAASVFVQTRIATKSIVETEEIKRLLENKPLKNMYFLPNQKLNRLLEDLTSLGEIVDHVPICSAELHRIVNVRGTGENSSCTISGICSLDNGCIVICDWQNKSLKRLDDNYNVAERLELSDQPYDICTVDASTVAVSLPKVKTIQFVCTEKAFKMTSSFSVGDACRGIAYASGLIYIACGGWKIFKEGQGHVEVYTTSGVLQRRFDEHLSQPGHIGLAGSRLYVADNNHGLVIMDTNGQLLKSFTHRDMHNTLAVCAGPGNQLFLGGWSSHNVMLLTNDGQLLLTLLTQKNGLKDLHTLFYDHLRSRLIYTMRDTDKIKMFDLDFKWKVRSI